MASEIILIAAVSENGVIGVEGGIPWNIKEDRDHFKELTTTHPVIMGRVTYLSIPQKYRPLPRRQNIVITRDASFSESGVNVAHSLEDALRLVGDQRATSVDGIDYSKIYIAGGERVYRGAIDLATKLEITHIREQIPSGKDTRCFPSISPRIWEEKGRVDKLTDGDTPGYSFVTYLRK